MNQATRPLFSGVDKREIIKSDFGDAPQTHLMLSKSDLAELSTLLGRNIQDSTDLLLAARNVTTLSVEGSDITLDSYLLNRLKSRCHPTQDFPEFLRERIKELLAGYCGA